MFRGQQKKTSKGIETATQLLSCAAAYVNRLLVGSNISEVEINESLGTPCMDMIIDLQVLQYIPWSVSCVSEHVLLYEVERLCFFVLGTVTDAVLLA